MDDQNKSSAQSLPMAFPLKKLMIGSLETDQGVLKHIGRGHFDLNIGDATILEIDITDMKELTQHYQPGENYLKIFLHKRTQKSALRALSTKMTEEDYQRISKESPFVLHLQDDLDDEKKDFLANILSGVHPVLPGDDELYSVNEIDDDEEMMKKGEIEHKKSSKKKGSNDELESVPQRKKARRQSESMNAVSDLSQKPSRNLRSKSKVNYAEGGLHMSDYYPDDNSIPEQLRNDIPSYLLVESLESNGNGNSETRIPLRNPFEEFDNAQVLLTYRGVTVRMEDYKCLDRRELLTDVILDFYIQYMFHEMMTDEQRKKVHIYSTAFYALYAMDKNYSGWKEGEESAAGKRYERVKDLPCNRNTNIFDKDFVVFPCNVREHWFLTIACYPKLNGSIKVNGGERVEGEVTRRDMKRPDAGEPLKSSCIIVFDSVKTNPGRGTTAIMHIRQFFDTAYMKSYQDDFPFLKSQLRGNVAKNCPQQSNATDCGLFVLEFIERFFVTSPIEDFRLPMDLTDWFDIEIIADKREQIATTIKTLILREGELPPLPPISFKSDPEVECIITETNIDNNNEEAFNNNNDFNVLDNNKVNDVSVEPVNNEEPQEPPQSTEHRSGLSIEPIDIALALRVLNEKHFETSAAPVIEKSVPLENESNEMEVDNVEAQVEPASNERCESPMEIGQMSTINSELKAPENDDAKDVIENMTPNDFITAVIDLDSE